MSAVGWHVCRQFVVTSCFRTCLSFLKFGYPNLLSEQKVDAILSVSGTPDMFSGTPDMVSPKINREIGASLINIINITFR